MPTKRVLKSPLVVAPLITIAIYGAYLALLGRLSLHIMGPLAPAFHFIAFVCLVAVFTPYFARCRQAPNLIVAPVLGLAIGYLSGLLSYFITVGFGDSSRFYQGYAASPLPSFLLYICVSSVLLLSWVPGGIAAVAIALVLRLTNASEAASRAS